MFSLFRSRVKKAKQTKPKFSVIKNAMLYASESTFSIIFSNDFLKQVGSFYW